MSYTVPGTTRVINLRTSLNPDGKACVICDLCGSAISLTATTTLRLFDVHRDSNKCHNQRKKLERLHTERLAGPRQQVRVLEYHTYACH